MSYFDFILYEIHKFSYNSIHEHFMFQCNISSILIEDEKKGKYYGTESNRNHNYGKRGCNEG